MVDPAVVVIALYVLGDAKTGRRIGNLHTEPDFILRRSVTRSHPCLKVVRGKDDMSTGRRKYIEVYCVIICKNEIKRRKSG